MLSERGLERSELKSFMGIVFDEKATPTRTPFGRPHQRELARELEVNGHEIALAPSGVFLPTLGVGEHA